MGVESDPMVYLIGAIFMSGIMLWKYGHSLEVQKVRLVLFYCNLIWFTIVFLCLVVRINLITDQIGMLFLRVHLHCYFCGDIHSV